MTTLNCTAKNFPGLMVLRVLLGCFESAIAPAYVHSPRTPFLDLFLYHFRLILITSMWYKRDGTFIFIHQPYYTNQQQNNPKEWEYGI
jgi:hypothetical protein